MFTDVLVTFLKLSVIIVLFIVAFSLGFHCLLGERDYFMHPFFSVLKTAVMMVGEMEFADLFLDEKGPNTYNVPSIFGPPPPLVK